MLPTVYAVIKSVKGRVYVERWDRRVGSRALTMKVDIGWASCTYVKEIEVL